MRPTWHQSEAAGRWICLEWQYHRGQALQSCLLQVLSRADLVETPLQHTTYTFTPTWWQGSCPFVKIKFKDFQGPYEEQELRATETKDKKSLHLMGASNDLATVTMTLVANTCTKTEPIIIMRIISIVTILSNKPKMENQLKLRLSCG